MEYTLFLAEETAVTEFTAEDLRTESEATGVHTAIMANIGKNLERILEKTLGKISEKDFNNRNNYERATETESFTTEEDDQDKIDDVAIFGGGKRILHSDNFKGGTITAIFGGSEVDLSNCKLAMGENVIDVMAIFGGMTIFVPSDWKIIVNVFPLFGGFSVKGRKDPNVDYDPAKALIIKGVVIFGGGEIKIYKKITGRYGNKPDFKRDKIYILFCGILDACYFNALPANGNRV